MSEVAELSLSDNPFCTRRVRPGALKYRFPMGQNAEQLIVQLSKHNWQGAIIGPHGSGKSTLLETLKPSLEIAGRKAISLTLHDGGKATLIPWNELLPYGIGNLLIVDGSEQWPFWKRAWVRRKCRMRGVGILVTAHRDIGLPALFTTETSAELVRELAEQLLRDYPPFLTIEDIEAARVAHSSDLREAFFTLYDLYEARKTQS